MNHEGFWFNVGPTATPPLALVAQPEQLSLHFLGRKDPITVSLFKVTQVACLSNYSVLLFCSSHKLAGVL